MIIVKAVLNQITKGLEVDRITHSISLLHLILRTKVPAEMFYLLKKNCETMVTLLPSRSKLLDSVPFFCPYYSPADEQINGIH